MYLKSRVKIFGWSLVSLFFSAVLMLPSGHGEGADSIADVPEIVEIESPAAVNNSELSIEDYFNQYFDRWGKVGGIYDSYIVVGDHARHLAPGVSTSGLKVGDYVGLKLKGRNMIIQIEKLQYRPESD